MNSNVTTLNGSNWITEKLKQKIRSKYEPLYKRELSDLEVEEIAENLTGVIEEILKWKWEEKYGNVFSRP